MIGQVARRMSLINHPKCRSLSGGQAIELLAREGDRLRFQFKSPMGQHYDCNFSFAGVRNQVTMAINREEKQEGNYFCLCFGCRGSASVCVSDAVFLGQVLSRASCYPVCRTSLQQHSTPSPRTLPSVLTEPSYSANSGAFYH